jgi:hypothetical protein
VIVLLLGAINLIIGVELIYFIPLIYDYMRLNIYITFAVALGVYVAALIACEVLLRRKGASISPGGGGEGKGRGGKGKGSDSTSGVGEFEVRNVW